MKKVGCGSLLLSVHPQHLCQRAGIRGITVCKYEKGKVNISDKDREIIEKSIADFAAHPEELDPAEELSRIESIFPRPLSRSEKDRLCECISCGVTDDEILSALEIGIIVIGRVYFSFMVQLLSHWINKELYGGEDVDKYKKK